MLNPLTNAKIVFILKKKKSWQENMKGVVKNWQENLGGWGNVWD